MQMMARNSTEGGGSGFGWLQAEVVRFDPASAEHGADLKVPHMGWNQVSVKRGDDPLFFGFGADARFYFAHSYHMVCWDSTDIVATACHGYEFPAAVRHGSVWGVQFHPEKSHRYGMQLLTNFIDLI
jgi:glutamine amidotransferase